MGAGNKCHQVCACLVDLFKQISPSSSCGRRPGTGRNVLRGVTCLYVVLWTDRNGLCLGGQEKHCARFATLARVVRTLARQRLWRMKKKRKALLPVQTVNFSYRGMTIIIGLSIFLSGMRAYYNSILKNSIKQAKRKEGQRAALKRTGHS